MMAGTWLIPISRTVKHDIVWSRPDSVGGLHSGEMGEG